MIHQRLTAFTIHILPVTAIKPDLLDIDPQNAALIVCSDDKNHFMNMFPHKLIIPFADTIEIRGANAISPSQARVIISFLKSLPAEVTDLYICCSEGLSRSPAVAAAVLKMSARSDMVIWNNPYYSPNKLVYQTICHEAGIFAPNLYVRILKTRNNISFKKSKKAGNTGKYERWQIIE